MRYGNALEVNVEWLQPAAYIIEFHVRSYVRAVLLAYLHVLCPAAFSLK